MVYSDLRTAWGVLKSILTQVVTKDFLVRFHKMIAQQNTFEVDNVKTGRAFIPKMYYFSHRCVLI